MTGDRNPSPVHVNFLDPSELLRIPSDPCPPRYPLIFLCVVTSRAFHNVTASQVLPYHSHNPDQVGIEVRRTLNQLQQKAVQETWSKTTAVVAGVVGNIPSCAVQGRMPDADLLRRQVKRSRKRAGPSLPPEPNRREDLSIPESLQVPHSLSTLRSTLIFAYA